MLHLESIGWCCCSANRRSDLWNMSRVNSLILHLLNTYEAFVAFLFESVRFNTTKQLYMCNLHKTTCSLVPRPSLHERDRIFLFLFGGSTVHYVTHLRCRYRTSMHSVYTSFWSTPTSVAQMLQVSSGPSLQHFALYR